MKRKALEIKRKFKSPGFDYSAYVSVFECHSEYSAGKL